MAPKCEYRLGRVVCCKTVHLVVHERVSQMLAEFDPDSTVSEKGRWDGIRGGATELR